MAETINLDLLAGGGGGIDRPVRPVAEDDFEPSREPSPEIIRELLNRNSMPNIIPFSNSQELGSLPPTLNEIYKSHYRSDKLPTNLGSIILRGIPFNNEDQSFN
jgi:hypothetical protein